MFGEILFQFIGLYCTHFTLYRYLDLLCIIPSLTLNVMVEVHITQCFAQLLFKFISCSGAVTID